MLKVIDTPRWLILPWQRQQALAVSDARLVLLSLLVYIWESQGEKDDFLAGRVLDVSVSI